MRGHAKGPFAAISSLLAVPVLCVQQQVVLTEGESFSFRLHASEEQPVFLRINAYTKVAATTGANSVIMGTPDNDDAYLAAGDIDEEATGFATEKKFLITEDITIIGSMTSAAIAASKALTISDITGADTQTVTIGATTYTFNTVLTDTANNVLIGADVTAMAANLVAAINAAAGAGTLYGTGTVANASVTATSLAGVVTVTARTPGTAGNAIVIGETLTNGAWAGGATTLSGGEAANSGAEVILFLDV